MRTSVINASQRLNEMIKSSTNKYKEETVSMLYHQLECGFIPRWVVTYHYTHPYERVRAIKETNKPFGYKDRIGYKTGGDMWKQVERDRRMIRKRKSITSVSKDSIEIQKVILQYLYDIKHPNKYWKYKLPPLFFFHEKGKKETENDNFTYHTHLILPDVKEEYNEHATLKDIFSTSIRKRRKCFSHWKDIDVTKIYEPKGAIDYVTKETNSMHTSFDFMASLIIHPETKEVIPARKKR